MLALDVSDCRVKLQRAATVLAEQNRVLPVVDPSYKVEVGTVDQSTGWCSVTVTVHKNHSPHTSAQIGDFIQNLRAALDYLVTILARASGQQIKSHHQFPIQTNAGRYAKEVRVLAAANKGPLAGLNYGLDVIDKHQPFNYTALNPDQDALSVLNRLSNADKHHQLLVLFSWPTAIHELVVTSVTPIIDTFKVETPEFELDTRVEIARFQVAKPYSNQPLTGTLNVTLNEVISAPAYPPKFPLGVAVDGDMLLAMRNRVSEIVDEIASL